MSNIKDFATGIIATAPSPASSGTTASVETGHGDRLPAVPFYATVVPEGTLSSLDEAEAWLVEAKSGDDLSSITRAQKGTSAQDVAVGWRITNAIYADDILTAVVDDTTPQLGGDLDVNGNNITSTAGLNVAIGASAGNDFTIDTDKLVVEGDTGNVGIGTASPTEALDVTGNIFATQTIIANSYVRSNSLIWASGGTAGTKIAARYENWDDTLGVSAITFAVKLSGSEFNAITWEKEQAWNSSSTAADKDIYLALNVLKDGVDTEAVRVGSEGNVGIGTTTPDTLLHNAGAYTQEPLSADPTDPDAGNSVQWVSDGTGSGDAGDVMMKINVGGTVKTVTIIDYSAA